MTTNNHLQKALEELKGSVTGLADLVKLQIEEVSKFLTTGEEKLEDMIQHREKRINDVELLIDSECEKILALYGPVATDLRLVLSVIEMNTHYERLGDLVEQVAVSVSSLQKDDLKMVVDEKKITDYLQTTMIGIERCMEGFNHEELGLTRDVFFEDRKARKELRKHKDLYVKSITENPEKADLYLCMSHVSRLVGRMTDMVDNIAEEIVFFIEAKVLKHTKKKHKVLQKIVQEEKLMKEANSEGLEPES